MAMTLVKKKQVEAEAVKTAKRTFLEGLSAHGYWAALLQAEFAEFSGFDQHMNRESGYRNPYSGGDEVVKFDERF